MKIDQVIEILESHLYTGKMPSKEHFEALAVAVEALKRQRWILCSERLPKPNQCVLFWAYRASYCYAGYYAYTSRSGDVWFEARGDTVEYVTAYVASHWMPIPEPPEEGGNENAAD